jgi:hypothetical protein
LIVNKQLIGGRPSVAGFGDGAPDLWRFPAGCDNGPVDRQIFVHVDLENKPVLLVGYGRSVLAERKLLVASFSHTDGMGL